MALPKDGRDVRAAGNQSGANDLATFGASPAAFAAFAPASFGDDPASAAPTAFRVSEARPAASDGEGRGNLSGAPDDGSAGGVAPVGTAGASALPAVPPVVPPASDAPNPATEQMPAAADGGIGPFVPMPYGSGAVSQPVAPPPPAQDGADAASAAAVGTAAAVPAVVDPATASLDTAMTSIATLQDAVAALADTLPGAAPSGDTAAAIGGAIDQVATTVGQAQAAVAATLDNTTHLLAQLGDDVAASVTSLTDGVAGSVAALTDAIALPAVAETLGTVAATVAALPEPVAPVVDSVGDILATAGDGLAGADPAAGITTLVGMVSAADAFNLHDMGSGANELLTPALGSLGAADLLADVAPADALLGINDDHHDGVLGGLHLDDGLHGLGL